MTSNNTDFLGRDCKSNNHYGCAGIWNGLGLEIYCYCDCHSKKEERCRVSDTIIDKVASRIYYDSKSDKPCTNSIFPLQYDFCQRLPTIFNCNLVKSIRAKHANLSMIAEYEQNDLFEQYCCSSDTEFI